jgi:hypothetical protein
MGFYRQENEPYLQDEAKAYFRDHNVRIVPFEKANSIGFERLFTSLDTGANYMCIPRQDWINVPIPYEPPEHCDFEINGVTVEKVVEAHVAIHFSGRKYMFSDRPDYFFAIEFEQFSYEMFSEFYQGHLTTGFILFDEKMDKAIFFELDLAINTYTRQPSLADQKMGGIDDKFWVEYFNDNFMSGISYHKHHIGVINDLYRPVIPGLRQFE